MPTNPPSPSPAPAAHSFSAASLTLEAAAFLALLLGLAYLFATNSAGAHWMQGYNPAGFWQLSTLIAALPVVV
ncbi:MAG: hypothetical protein ABR860_13450, partial [Terracidiphilus sp.]